MAHAATYGSGTEQKYRPVDKYKYWGAGWGTEESRAWESFGNGTELQIWKGEMYSFCFAAPFQDVLPPHDELIFRRAELLRTMTVDQLNGVPIDRTSKLIYEFLKSY